MLNSIITLNYDLVCDYALYLHRGSPKINVLLEASDFILSPNTYLGSAPASFASEEMEKGFYLKLHGSLHWVYCRNSSCPNNRYIFVNHPIGKMIRRHSPGSPCNLCGANIVSVIIPPSLTKSFEKVPKMGLIWNLAFRELVSAERWVLIGMSLPPSDCHLNWLLREAASKREGRPRPKLEVANPDVVKPEKSLSKRISQIVGVDEDEILKFEGLEDYVNKLPDG